MDLPTQAPNLLAEDLFSFGYLAPIVLSPETLAAVTRECEVALASDESSEDDRYQATMILDGITTQQGGG